jgi:hypothetical protein
MENKGVFLKDCSQSIEIQIITGFGMNRWYILSFGKYL